MRIVLYARKSTDDSKHQKASIDDQKKWFTRYIESLKAKGETVEIVRTFEEKMSSKSPGRPLFAEMMEIFYSGKADAIITWDIDRLSRNEVDEGTIKWAIRQGKIKEVHTLNHIYSADELLMMSMFFAVSAEEIKKLRERATRRDLEVLRSGGIPYHAPMGYKHVGEGMVIPNEKARWVKKMFELRAMGRSYAEIGDHLFDLGFKTSSGRKIPKSTIETIIKNEFYIGVTKFMNEIGEGKYEKIIPLELFNLANGIKRTTSGYVHRSFELKGIVTSARTGRRMTASIKKGKYVYYHEHGDEGSLIKISETEIIEKFGEIIHNYVFPAELLPEVRESIKKWMNKEDILVDSETRIIDSELKDISATERNLKDKYIDGKVDEEYYIEKLAELARRRVTLQTEKDNLFVIDMQNALHLEKSVELLTSLSDTWLLADRTKRLEIIRNIAVELEIDEQKRLKIHEKEPFDGLSSLNMSLWLPYADDRRTGLIRLFRGLMKTNVKSFLS